MRSILAAIALLVVVPAGLADDHPRYQLPVGRKLVYSFESHDKTVKGNQNDFDNVGTYQLIVVRENPEGSRRVVFRSASTFTQIFAGGKHASPERVDVCYADVFPDGRVLANPTLSMHTNLGVALPRLPRDEAELATGWKDVDEMREQSLSFKPAASGGGEFVFTSEQDGIFRKMYSMTHESTYHFDRGKGIITRVDSKTSQDYGFHNKGTGITKLDSDETIPADQVAQMAADYETYFTAREKYEKLLHDVLERPAKADELIAAGKKTMDEAAAQLKSDDAKAEATRFLKSHEEDSKYYKEAANRFAGIIGKPAADWSSTDIDGKPAKLADYRGKVVVMDFWYRGCGWCIRAMPQVKQLAADYKDKPVTILSMNTDREVEDARFVVKEMGLTYPTIKAEGIPDQYGVQGFPTLIIVDQQGVVRDVHVGFSTTLREKVAKKIDELLAKSG